MITKEFLRYKNEREIENEMRWYEIIRKEKIERENEK